ncbi:HalOD1 output domain-containing protein [Natronococcus occultus]|uniref:Halobacterial output domain-containing protein n=1 Tax=Natronococcus occultus SP4 TaxID=694430 RepID=L0K605_9EURY|nr:HalOD1 output domain-containing protein [Natronococcus occultus]AGB39965.1 hypothetical protein Natoc_4273 [Natronococcus occultus SP4]
MGDMSTQFGGTSSQDTPTVSATWERGTENTPVYAVVSAVAEAEDADPVALPPLYEAIDPEALNALLAAEPETAVGTVAFRYAGYDVEVTGDGDVSVRSA